MAPLYDISCVFFNFSDGNFADDGRIPQDFFKILGWSFVCHKKLIIHMPYPSVLDFLKIKLEKSNLTNWIFSLFRTGLLPPAQPGKINFEIDFCRSKIQFLELDFSNLIFQKSSTDGQCVRLLKIIVKLVERIHFLTSPACF